MKHLLPTIILLFLINFTFAQGLNNKYDIDSEDLKNVFKEQGVDIFKFPFDLKKGEYISISYEIYQEGILMDKKNIIEDMQIGNGITMDHHISRKDTVIFHRFYFLKKNDTLVMRQNFPGASTIQKINLSNITIGGFNSRVNVSPDLLNKEEILFYYGNLKKRKNDGKSKGWLMCSTGIPKNELIKNYDFVILFYAERITKERTKTILKEIKNMN